MGIDLQVSIPGRPTGTLALTMSRTKPKAGKPAGKGEYSAPALEKGIEIVELLASEAPGLTISEIAARLGRSINEVFRMIIVMQRRGWLQRRGLQACRQARAAPLLAWVLLSVSWLFPKWQTRPY